MSLRALVKQAIADNVSQFKEVSGAASLEAVMARRVNAPGCYVFRYSNQVGPNKSVNLVSQAVYETVGCLIVTHNVADNLYENADDESEQYCGLVRDVLFGQVLAEGYAPMEYGGGRLVGFKDGFLYWLELYRAQSFWRSK